jgi:NAD-dependent dihydropyrimidine dehydrogenase PreA subunit/flavodoxin
MIFYLSGTGNTKWAAKTLAALTNEKLLFIPDMMRQYKDDGEYHLPELSDGERVGFCFPVHGWRPPTIVRDFVANLSLDVAGHYIYALCTAGDNIGETMSIFRKDLTARGFHLDAAFSLIMPESYMGLPFFNVDKPEKEQEKIENAAADIKTYGDAILARRSEEHLVIGRWPRIDSRFLGGFFTRYLITDSPFWVDSRKCVKCGICADVCPTHNITGGLGYEPHWNHDGSCLACFACYHHCPHHAIEYGRMTKGKGQYFFNRPKGR